MKSELGRKLLAQAHQKIFDKGVLVGIVLGVLMTLQIIGILVYLSK